LNRRPVDYESTALPTELRRPRTRRVSHLWRVFFNRSRASVASAGHSPSGTWVPHRASECLVLPGGVGKVVAKWARLGRSDPAWASATEEPTEATRETYGAVVVDVHSTARHCVPATGGPDGGPGNGDRVAGWRFVSSPVLRAFLDTVRLQRAAAGSVLDRPPLSITPPGVAQ
jgi:hypothetical protein